MVHRVITSNLIKNWSYSIQSHNCLDYGECIDTNRVSIRLLASNVDEHKDMIDNTCNNIVENIHGYRFRQHIDDTIAVDHNVDIIKLGNYSFDMKKDVDHSRRAPRVVGIVSCDNSIVSTLTAYRE